MKFGKIRNNCENVNTRPTLNSSATKLLKLVYAPVNVTFLRRSYLSLL